MRLLIPTIFILIALALFFVYIDPAYSDVQELRAQEAEFDAALERSRELISVRDALLATYNEIPEEQLERLRKLLPDHVDNIRLILDIDNIASRYGMTVNNLAFAGEEQSPGQAPQDGALGPQTNEIGSATFSFSVSATYEVMKQFLNDLENSLRIVDVVALSFSSGDGGLSTYNITLRTYWLR